MAKDKFEHYQGIDASLLEFQKKYKEAELIQVQDFRGRMRPSSKEIILNKVAKGFYRDKITAFFTPESIQEALAAKNRPGKVEQVEKQAVALPKKEVVVEVEPSKAEESKATNSKNKQKS